MKVKAVACTQKCGRCIFRYDTDGAYCLQLNAEFIHGYFLPSSRYRKLMKLLNTARYIVDFGYNENTRARLEKDVAALRKDSGK